MPRRLAITLVSSDAALSAPALAAVVNALPGPARVFPETLFVGTGCGCAGMDATVVRGLIRAARDPDTAHAVLCVGAANLASMHRSLTTASDLRLKRLTEVANLVAVVTPGPGLGVAEQAGCDLHKKAPAEALVERIESASTVIVAEGDTHFAELVRRLNPKAAVSVGDDAPQLSTEGGAGRVGSHSVRLAVQHAQDSPVAFAFETPRPFHPTRLAALLEGGELGAVRVRGFVWLATQMSAVAKLSAVGTTWNLAPVGRWYADYDDLPDTDAARHVRATWWVEPYGDRRQTLAVTSLAPGPTFDAASLHAKLEAALLTDEEFGWGQLAWRYFEDPLRGCRGAGPKVQP